MPLLAFKAIVEPYGGWYGFVQIGNIRTINVGPESTTKLLGVLR